mmetsp:Transcript_11859/g.18289  ORF Transcript_11859/g.18289 Transcript_11859/m.18289 type:complete len:185 (+) Transcript_11859:580-1134(+)
MNDTLIFVGECTTDTFYTLEFQATSYGNWWSHGLYAASSTVNYAVLMDFASAITTHNDIVVYKIEFDPDPANCASLAHLTEPIVSLMRPLPELNRRHSWQVNGVYFDPYREAAFFMGMAYQFLGEEENHLSKGFIIPKTFAEMEADFEVLPTEVTTSALFSVPSTFSINSKVSSPSTSSPGGSS